MNAINKFCDRIKEIYNMNIDIDDDVRAAVIIDTEDVDFCGNPVDIALKTSKRVNTINVYYGEFVFASFSINSFDDLNDMATTLSTNNMEDDPENPFEISAYSNEIALSVRDIHLVSYFQSGKIKFKLIFVS